MANIKYVLVLPLLFLITPLAMASVQIDSYDTFRINNADINFSSTQTFTNIDVAFNYVIFGSGFFQITSTDSINRTNVTINYWNVGGDYSKSWRESSGNNSLITSHVIGNLPVNTQFNILVDGVVNTIATSNSTGFITFDYVGGVNNRLFQITMTSETLILNWCNPYESSLYGGLQFGTILTFVIGAALLFYGFRNANFTLMIAGVAVIVGSIIALSIGVAVISRMLVCQ